MKQQRWLTILRWLCVLPAVALSFVASIFLALHLNSFIYEELFRFGFVVPTEDGVHSELIWDGPLAAIFFVLSGTLVAPRYRRQVAFTLCGLGAILTPGLVRDFSFSLYGMSPAAERLSTVCTHWTIAGTYLGGVLAVAVVFIATGRSASHSEEIPPGSTSATRPA